MRVCPKRTGIPKSCCIYTEKSVTINISNGLSIHHLLLSLFLVEHTGSPYWFLAKDHSKETIKMVKARGYEVWCRSYPFTRLKSDVGLRRLRNEFASKLRN
jgi:hypothetical protein